MAHDVDETRSRLLEAAGEIFAEKGFQAATVREICGRAGVNLAAINYHFGDKERLYVEAVKHAHHCGGQQVPPEWAPGTPPEEKLRDLVHGAFLRLLAPRRPAWHSQLMAREISEPTHACVELVESYIRAHFELLDGILEELMPPETPAEDRHLVAFSIVGQCIHFKLHRPIAELLIGREELERYNVERLTEHVTRFTLAALGRAEPFSGSMGTACSRDAPRAAARG